MNKLYSFISIVFIFASILSVLTQLEYFKIKNFSILGANNIDNVELRKNITDILSTRTFLVFSNDNLLFLKREEISRTLLEKYKVIESVSFDYSSKNSFDLNIKERVPKALYCKDEYPVIANCYFIDRNGMIYLSSPNVTANSLMRYYRNIEGDVLGQYVLDTNIFRKVFSFNESLKKMQIVPQAFSIKSDAEYRSIVFGSSIIIDNKVDLNIALESLESMIREKVFEIKDGNLVKIKSIDLRFGNKIPIEYTD